MSHGTYAFLVGMDPEDLDKLALMSRVLFSSQPDRWSTAYLDGIMISQSVIAGDVDIDGFVGGSDLSTIITNWGMTGASREHGDVTGDNLVSGPDYQQVIDNWGSGVLPTEPGAIPEPITLALLGLGGALVLMRRRQ